MLDGQVLSVCDDNKRKIKTDYTTWTTTENKKKTKIKHFSKKSTFGLALITLLITAVASKSS